jgi:hypothetical protein
MLKYGEVNPLNVHGLREVEHCPPHFTVANIHLSTGVTQIKNWIWENLQGRFYIGNTVFEPSIGNTVSVAFEIPGEASYFALSLPQINVGIDFDF